MLKNKIKIHFDFFLITEKIDIKSSTLLKNLTGSIFFFNYEIISFAYFDFTIKSIHLKKKR